MKIYIKETGEIKDLIIKDDNEIEWTYDLINAADFWNCEKERYEMPLADYEWWTEYITNYEADKEEAKELAEELGIDIETVNDRIIKALYGINDMADEHIAKQKVFEELRSEYK